MATVIEGALALLISSMPVSGANLHNVEMVLQAIFLWAPSAAFRTSAS